MDMIELAAPAEETNLLALGHMDSAQWGTLAGKKKETGDKTECLVHSLSLGV